MQKDIKQKKSKKKTFRMDWGNGLWADVEGTSDTDVRSRLGSFFGGFGVAYQPERIKKVKPWMSGW
jgi:hypothetical protein